MRNVSLGIKISAGFAIMLIFICIVAFMGFISLSDLVNRASKSERANELVKSITESRVQVLTYMERNDDTFVAKAKNLIHGTIDKAGELKNIFSRQANKDQMDHVIEKNNSYLMAFDELISLRHQKNQAMTIMEDKASIVIKQAEDVRIHMQTQLTDVRKNNATRVKEKIALADDANHMVKIALEAKALRASLTYEYKPTLVTEWKKVNANFYGIAKNMRTRFTNEANIKKIDAIISGYHAYEKAALQFFKNRSDQASQTMVKEATTTTKYIYEIREDQKAQLNEVEKHNEEYLTDKLTKFDDANLIIKLLLEIQKNEKQFIISNEQKFKNDVKAGFEAITILAQNLKSRCKNQKNIDLINGLLKAVQTYNSEFDHYTDLTVRQEQSHERMVKEAEEAVAVCISAKAKQKAEMDFRISTANYIMVIGTIIAVLLGILFAFLITRSITKPVNRIIEGLNEGSNQVASASSQVSSSSQSLAEGASEQAASIEETSSSMEELSSMTKKNAENAGHANILMKDANRVVITANESMEQLITSMEDISKASKETQKIIKNH